MHLPQDLQASLLTDSEEPLSSMRAMCCGPTTPQLPMPQAWLQAALQGAFPYQPQEPFRCITISRVHSQWQPPSWQASPLGQGTTTSHWANACSCRSSWISVSCIFFCLLCLLLPHSLGTEQNFLIALAPSLRTNQNIHVTLPSFFR